MRKGCVRLQDRAQEACEQAHEEVQEAIGLLGRRYDEDVAEVVGHPEGPP